MLSLWASIWPSLSSAVKFQVLIAAVGTCSVDSTVTPISTTVHTTTKLKLLLRFAKRTPWWLLTRSREYEEDSVFDFENRERSALKQPRLEPNLLSEGSVFLFWFVTHSGHFSPVHESSCVFSALFLFGCDMNTFGGFCVEQTVYVRSTEGGEGLLTEWGWLLKKKKKSLLF